MSATARSADWVTAEYNNQNSPATFYTISEASGGAAATAGIHWLVTDHLGTPRIILDQTGSLATVSRHDYLPFGEELYAGTGGRTTAQGYTANDNVRQKFTSQERDNETGLDYFLARYYSSGQGRFASPDPTLMSVKSHNPQTWNRYSYVMNSPLAYTDPYGLWAIARTIWYRIKGYDQNGEAIYETDSKGKRKIDHVSFVAYKTQDNDDGATLAKQLGLAGGEAAKFASEVGSQTSVQLHNTTGPVKSFYDTIEELYGSQLKHEAAGNKMGPTNITYADCSSTATKLMFPSKDVTDWSLQDADQTIDDENLQSVGADKLRIGDLVRYADSGNNPRHFTTFIFRTDDGVPIVFSRSGGGGPFQWNQAGLFENSLYGTIRGKGKDPTGYYSRK